LLFSVSLVDEKFVVNKRTLTYLLIFFINLMGPRKEIELIAAIFFKIIDLTICGAMLREEDRMVLKLRGVRILLARILVAGP